MKGEGDDDRYSEEETAQRRDEVIRRMAKMPPQPRHAPDPNAKQRLLRTSKSAAKPPRTKI
jgi:hypothetical protein